MPKIALTDVTVRNLPLPERGQQTYFDSAAGVKGFGLRISSGGARTFIVMAGPEHERRRHVLGHYPVTSLSDARKEARRIVSELTLGLRPAHSISFPEAIEIYFKTHCLKNSERHQKEVARILKKHFKPALGNKKLADITTADLTGVLDPLTKSTPILANALYANIKTFFNWSVRRGYISNSPCARLHRPASVVTRDRVLTSQELRKVYLAAKKLGYPYGYITLMCIHLLARRGEIAQLNWSNITSSSITFPAAITKSKRELILPNLLENDLALIPKNGDLLFPSAAGTPFSAWSKNKIRLNRLAGFADFTLHDLRRTMATFMAEHTEPHIIELILNHASPASLGGPIARIYNRHKYANEIKAALLRQEGFLSKINVGK